MAVHDHFKFVRLVSPREDDKTPAACPSSDAGLSWRPYTPGALSQAHLIAAWSIDTTDIPTPIATAPSASDEALTIAGNCIGPTEAILATESGVVGGYSGGFTLLRLTANGWTPHRYLGDWTQ